MFSEIINFMRTLFDVRLEFAESGDSLAARLTDMSGAHLPFQRGVLGRSTVTFDGTSLRISNFVRTLLIGRVESWPKGSAVVLRVDAPLLKVGGCLWWITVLIAAYWLFGALIIGRISLEYLLKCFLISSIVGSCVFPALWGRAWLSIRIAAALSDHLHAHNDADLKSRLDSANLSRRGALTAGLSTFLWAPFVALRGFPGLFGHDSLPAPWAHFSEFLLGGSIDAIFALLLFGWAFVAGGAFCGYLTNRLLTDNGKRAGRWLVTILSLGFSLSLCWLMGNSTTLERLFYIP